ncbi:(2Fe-2S) ferredoxin domain-containing protein [Sphaerospermopsis sp. LEGE 08334]|jgi:NADH:ubiquinone oxidoreductase subunit E|uniref:(2Fe-2S) ferredoxin domain-containing protein n=1 Tax=Sphaerospermopsis sp. LEGE 08334 TaxID=1828651 RepID=UPI001880D3B1|nr:(2Fe-2S) ferredoxin domain-containing protein [Sphaerospermopsis sp. LEGE 08334]MBE9054669.1 (2Fe-2S) ferredoxin domain-containing protein [Sphaerospermopsis sp. LEGE 08334]
MSIYTGVEVSEFCLEGRFLDFVIKDGYKLKGLLLATSEGECYVKLAKHLRVAFDLRLPRGTWLQVVGTKKYDAKKEEVTLKAERVMAGRSEVEIIAPNLNMERVSLAPETSKPKTAKKQTILMCQKSDCMKRGGKALCQVLESELSDRGLQDTVNIKGTGCMKNCKAGPNLVMPDKTRYTKVQPSQVAILVDKHFGEDAEIKSPQFMEV